MWVPCGRQCATSPCTPQDVLILGLRLQQLRWRGLVIDRTCCASPALVRLLLLPLLLGLPLRRGYKHLVESGWLPLRLLRLLLLLLGVLGGVERKKAAGRHRPQPQAGTGRGPWWAPPAPQTAAALPPGRLCSRQHGGGCSGQSPRPVRREVGRASSCTREGLPNHSRRGSHQRSMWGQVITGAWLCGDKQPHPWSPWD